MQPESIPPVIGCSSDPSHNGFRRIVRYLLAGNPFFILSAVLLLYAMRRLSFDSRLFSTEVSQLIFNFSSFQFYELILIGTAIFLAHRRIWYDSTLLVFIENLFAFVPLMLVSQALLVENSVAAILCTGGAILFALRTTALSRFIRSLNFPPRLLAFALLLLIVNVAAPVLTRHLHRDLTTAKWDEIAMQLANVEWFVAAPLLVLTGLLLTGKPKESPGYFSRREFPLLTLLLWIAGTCVHFYCINYVYGLPSGVLRVSLAAPAIWTACWVFWLRAGDVTWASPQCACFYNKSLLAAAVVTLLLPAESNDRTMLLTLGAMNIILFAALSFKTKDWFNVLLLAISAAMTTAALRLNITTRAPLSPTEIEFGQTFWMAVGAFLFIRSVVSRDARFGLLAGFLAAVFAPILFHGVRDPFAVIEIGLGVMVLHSIRWDDKFDPHSNAARIFVTALWLLNSIALACSDYAHSYWAVFISGLVIFIAALVARWIVGYWAHRIIAFAALAVMAIPPTFKSADLLDNAPAGPVVLLASFVLFAAGIMTALLRSRWLAKAADGRIVQSL
jgi:hypothetical protein